jgi:hypothetical protein
MTTEEIQRYAATLVLEHACDVEYLSVFEMAEEFHGEEIGDEDGRAVHDLVRAAIVTVTFPGCDLVWSNKDEDE